MKGTKMGKYLLCVVFLISMFGQAAFAQDGISISVKGISDSKKDGTQKDRQEAIMNAKRQACEKAGVQLKSETKVENFQAVFDYIESKAEAALMPGFQIIDIGYVADDTYQVVLSGKIKVAADEKISTKEMRYAKSLFDQKNYRECKKILGKYIDSKDSDVDEKIKEEALYYYIKWGFSFNAKADCEKFAAYYPDSPRKEKILKYSTYSQKPILSYDKVFETNDSQWTDNIYKHKSNEYQKMIQVANDTLYFKDLDGNDNLTRVQLYLLSSIDSENKKPTAYLLKIAYADSETGLDTDQDTKHFKTVVEKFRDFNRKGSKSFQHSATGKTFGKFELKYSQIKGDVPIGQEKYKHNLKFAVYANGF